MRARPGVSLLLAALACAGLSCAGLSCAGSPPDAPRPAAPVAAPKVPAPAPVASAEAPPPRTPLLTCDARPLRRSAPRDAPAAEPAVPKSVEAARKAAAQKALRRVPDVQKTVSKLRGLPFKKPVPAQYRSAADFRSYVDREVGRDASPQEMKDTGRALFHIGLFTEPVDLGEMVSQTLASQVGAYYDPHEGKFFVVMVVGEGVMFDAMVAHELTHAVQDQHFGLEAYYKPASGSAEKELRSDAIHARRFVVEGEATLMMVAYPFFAQNNVNLLDKEELTRATLGVLSSVDAQKLRGMSQSQLEQGGDLGEDVTAAMRALDDIPPFILLPLLGAYLKGTVPVHEMYAARGWAGVAELYTHPPESTEQVLHPVEKLLGARDMPVTLALPAPPSGSRELMVDTLGELGWRAYFETWCTNDLEDAAAGWDGDTVAVHETGSSTLGVVATTWDTEQDAIELLDAYAGSLAARFPGSKVERDGERAQVKRPDGTLVIAERRGLDVLIVDGATDPGQIALAVPASRDVAPPVPRP